MCKKLGAYPNCQCPGFNGEPASSDDTRGCYTKYCQDHFRPTATHTGTAMLHGRVETVAEHRIGRTEEWLYR